jgi:hypothetical protein
LFFLFGLLPVLERFVLPPRLFLLRDLTLQFAELELQVGFGLVGQASVLAGFLELLLEFGEFLLALVVEEAVAFVKGFFGELARGRIEARISRLLEGLSRESKVVRARGLPSWLPLQLVDSLTRPFWSSSPSGCYVS